MDIRTGDIFDYEAMDNLNDKELMKQLGDKADELKAMQLPPTDEQLKRKPEHPMAVGQVSPDDPCPCGSGKKFEDCCKTPGLKFDDIVKSYGGLPETVLALAAIDKEVADETDIPGEKRSGEFFQYVQEKAVDRIRELEDENKRLRERVAQWIHDEAAEAGGDK